MAIPSSVLTQLGDPSLMCQERVDPWLPFAWPVQLGSDGILWGSEAASDIDWAFVVLQLRLSHPPVPLVILRDPSSGADPVDTTARILAWGINRVVQGVLIDQQLPQYGFTADASQGATLEALLQLAPQIPDYAQALLALELIYRGIDPGSQAKIRATCGEDVTKAAHQMNMMCIKPEDPDRTVLQVQHIALKFCGDQEAALAERLQVRLSDGRLV